MKPLTDAELNRLREIVDCNTDHANLDDEDILNRLIEYHNHTKDTMKKLEIARGALEASAWPFDYACTLICEIIDEKDQT